MAWRKLGRIFVPRGDRWWARGYAAFPTVEIIDDDVVRVYFTALDAEQHGRGGFVDLAADDLTRVLAVSQEPVLDIGAIGAFDDCGANPFSVVTFGGEKLLYYQGWQRMQRAPYAIFTGLAAGPAGGAAEFRKIARTPILERTEAEQHIRGAPFILADGARLRMWYVASSEWRTRGDRLHYVVSVSHGVSADGRAWKTEPCQGLGPLPGREYAVGRPTVLREGGLFRMWYSVRSFDEPYAIGYAESSDGISWQRKDREAGIARSATGWDSEMICYPCVAAIGGRLVMFYNGNRHGESGFGCAELC